MKKKIQAVYTCLLLGAVVLVLAGLAWFHRPQEISVSERRKLEQLPALSLQTIAGGGFMEKFEGYSQDQFPFRDSLRQLKSAAAFYLYRQKDIHGVYLAQGHAAAIDAQVDAQSVGYAAQRFEYLYDTWLKDKDMTVYASIVPDKGYYLAEKNGYPAMDYELLFALLEDGMPYARFIGITDLLSEDSYYYTDGHWRQEKLTEVAARLRTAMGANGGQAEALEYEAETATEEFYGVYFGQAALPMKPDTIRYLTNAVIENAVVYNYENGETGGVYDWKEVTGRDPYEFYLSGASALLEIDNPLMKEKRELIVFRDSFGSSLIPLLIADYSHITVIDIRYAASRMLGQAVDFEEHRGADVLFLYGTTVLNNSRSLR